MESPLSAHRKRRIEVKDGEVKSGEVKGGDVDGKDVKSGNIDNKDVKSGNIDNKDVKSGNVDGKDVKSGEVEDKKKFDVLSHIITPLANHVMSFLQLENVIASAKVCRKWNSIAYNGGISRRHFEMTSKMFKLCSNLPPHKIACIKNITIRKISEEEFLELSMKLVGLTHLSILDRCFLYCPKAYKYLRNLKKLTHLEVSRFNDLLFYGVESANLQDIFCLSQLRGLLLRDSCDLSLRQLAAINHDNFPFLESLVLSRIRFVDDVKSGLINGDKESKDVKDSSDANNTVATTPLNVWRAWSTLNLKYFKISACSGLIRNIFPRWPIEVDSEFTESNRIWDSVDTLAICESDWIDDEVFRIIPILFPSLTTLDLTSGSHQPTCNIGLSYLVELKGLKYLKVGRMNALSYKSLLDHISHISSLETLELRYWDGFKFTAKNVLPLNRLRRLRILDSYGYRPRIREIIGSIQIPRLEILACDNDEEVEKEVAIMKKNFEESGFKEDKRSAISIGGLYYGFSEFHVTTPFNWDY